MKNSDTTFKLAAAYNALKEGGLTDDPDDPGGITNHGFSIRYAIGRGDADGDGLDDFDFNRDGTVNADDMRMMTEADALKQRRAMWNEWRCGEIEEPSLAIKYFDMSFPLGNRRAGRALQRALRAVGRPVNEDGRVGDNTLAAINSCRSPAALLAAFISECAGIFRLQRSEKYERGWLNRAYELPYQENNQDE